VKYEGTLQGVGTGALAPTLTRVIRGVFYIYVIALPFQPLRFVERNGFIVLLVMLAVWCLVNRTHFFERTPIDLPLIAFVVWVGLSIPFATFPGYSLKEFGKLLQQVLIFYMVVHFFKAQVHSMRLVWILVGTSIVMSLYGIAEFAGLMGVLPSLKRPTLLESLTSGEVWLTTYLVMIIPLCLCLMMLAQRRRERALYVGATALGIFCLLLTFSRAGLLALLAELGMLASFLRRKLLIVIVALFFIGMIALQFWFIQNNVHVTGVSRGLGSCSFLHRLEIWDFTTKKILEHAVLGIGYGKDNFQLVYRDSAEPAAARYAPVLDAGTHNIFLDLALGAGIPATVFFIWLLWRMVATLVRKFLICDAQMTRAVALGVAGSVVGMVVRLIFDQMFIGTLAIQFWILVAIGLSMPCAESHAVREAESSES
jgi:putative inorganic carbon (HCO3(-)) transporter